MRDQLSRQALKFQNRQKEQHMQRNLSMKKKKEPEKEIYIHDFCSLPIIQKIDFKDYSSLHKTVSREIHSDKYCRNSISLILENLFLKFPNSIHTPNKEYSRLEREANKSQVNLFKKRMKVLEIKHNSESDRMTSSVSVGDFSNKENFSFKTLGQLMASPVWEGKEKYDLIYLVNISSLREEDDELELYAGSELFGEYKRLEGIVTELDENEEEKVFHEKFEKEFGGYIKDNDKEFKELSLVKNEGDVMLYFLDKYAKEIGTESEIYNAVNTILEFGKISAKFQDIAPKTEEVVLKISDSLKPKGVMIIVDNDQPNIQNLSEVYSDRYDEVNRIITYQNQKE